MRGVHDNPDRPDLRTKDNQSAERVDALRRSSLTNLSEHQFAQKDLLLGPPSPYKKKMKSGQFPEYKGVGLTRGWSEDPQEYKKQTTRIDRFGSLAIPTNDA